MTASSVLRSCLVLGQAAGKGETELEVPGQARDGRRGLPCAEQRPKAAAHRPGDVRLVLLNNQDILVSICYEVILNEKQA